MNYTTNYNLKKPGGTDAINVGDFNDNADTLDSTLKSVSDTAAAKYSKPAGGIPESDLASAVQTAIDSISGKYTKPATGIPETDLSEDVANKIDCIQITFTTDNDLSTFSDWKINSMSATEVEVAEKLKDIYQNNHKYKIASTAGVNYRMAECRNDDGDYYIVLSDTKCDGIGSAVNPYKINQKFIKFDYYRNSEEPEVEISGCNFETSPDVYITVGSNPTHRQIPTAKGVYDFITGSYSTTAQMNTAIATATADKQNVPSQITSGESITLADNTEYRLTGVTTLTIAYPTGNFECWMRISTATSGTVTITLPSSQYIGDTPTFGNSETWELSIKDGIVIANKVGA